MSKFTLTIKASHYDENGNKSERINTLPISKEVAEGIKKSYWDCKDGCPIRSAGAANMNIEVAITDVDGNMFCGWTNI